MKGMILVIDGLGDRPVQKLGNKTPLQKANTPNLDKIAENGINGIMDSIAPGIRPGSDTAHIAILGYDPYAVYTGRGPFEAFGVGLNIKAGDIAFRCNFSTVDDEFIVVDRRAGRIKEDTSPLIEELNKMKIEGYEDIEIIFKKSTGHRAVLVLRGANLSDEITDADPKVVEKPLKTVYPTENSSNAKKTADLLNKIIKESYNVLKNHPLNLNRIGNNEIPANIVIPRGVGIVPEVEEFNKKYGLNSACIAETGLIIGIARFAGMDIIEVEGSTGSVNTNLDKFIDTILNAVNNTDHDFFLINIKGADESGHDGNAEEKMKFIEKVDKIVFSKISQLQNIVTIVTADHSTPVTVKDHSADPVPVLIYGNGVRVDDVKRFNEIDSVKGGLLRIRGSDLMNILTDLMDKTHKFGA
ncbi:MAG: 2,3-bisphosphoglycerate-independent phosphoglycerate mutase [Methanobrevibacter sp.]|jgi:2,3-bisphosphoglycerate-independent phosphoglycerate mutase|nr:2,3-bisphosphoglycerate-independent phosphoglycerate mutase [Candidatus Methanovirga basalitermitum]